jgi:hypothetical protein
MDESDVVVGGEDSRAGEVELPEESLEKNFETFAPKKIPSKKSVLVKSKPESKTGSQRESKKEIKPPSKAESKKSLASKKSLPAKKNGTTIPTVQDLIQKQKPPTPKIQSKTVSKKTSQQGSKQSLPQNFDSIEPHDAGIQLPDESAKVAGNNNNDKVGKSRKKIEPMSVPRQNHDKIADQSIDSRDSFEVPNTGKKSEFLSVQEDRDANYIKVEYSEVDDLANDNLANDPESEAEP